MAVQVRIPAVLRKHFGGSTLVEGPSGTLRDLLDDLSRRHPGFGPEVVEETGELRRFVNVYVNDEDVRYLEGLDTKINEGDVVSILPAVAGGTER